MKSLKKTRSFEAILAIILLVSMIYFGVNYLVLHHTKNVTEGQLLSAINNTYKFIFWCCLSYPGIQTLGHNADIYSARSNLRKLHQDKTSTQTERSEAKRELYRVELVAEKDNATSIKLLCVGVAFLFFSVIMDVFVIVT